MDGQRRSSRSRRTGDFYAFLDAAATLPSPPAIVKVQLVGPLTLGVAFLDDGSDLDHAFARAVDVCRAWASALTRLVADRLPSSDLVMFLDEPTLVLWRDGDPPVAVNAPPSCCRPCSPRPPR